jgi:hypothetical protein
MQAKQELMILLCTKDVLTLEDIHRVSSTYPESVYKEAFELDQQGNIFKEAWWAYEKESGMFECLYWCKEDIEEDSRLNKEKGEEGLVAERLPRKWNHFYGAVMEMVRDFGGEYNHPY